MTDIKAEIRKFIAKGDTKKAISALLKLNDNENEAINQLTILASRFNLVSKQHNLGSITNQEFFLEYTKINDSILALLGEIESLKIDSNYRVKLSVLVVGTGQENLPDREVWISEELGKMLGKNAWKLISGGWHGVDKIVSENFSAQIVNFHKQKLSKFLTQIVPKGTDPIFLGGDVYYIDPGINEWIKCLNIADVVITVGGVDWEAGKTRGGTYLTFKYAMQERVPVIPIYGSGGDSVEIFQEMIDSWDNVLMKNIPKKEFIDTLYCEVNSKIDAIRVVDRIESLLIPMRTNF